MAKKRNTPTLELTPELPQVRSRDFNLFYRPERRPQDAGVKEFTTSLTNFVNGAGSSMAIVSEIREKKENVAKAVQDYTENKQKFKEAVKSGAIDKTANPYYLEKYKELSLNEYASEFNDVLVKQYGSLDVKNNITEGGFDNFYQDTLKTFFREKNLGTFNPIELENGFFKETSNYRASLEAQHKQTQLELFKKKFDEKVTNRVVGIVLKYKNYEADVLTDDGEPSTNKFKLIADEINKEISALIDVTGDGRSTIDQAFKGLENFVNVTDDFEFAKQVITKVPEFLIGGTDSVAKIGRIKVKQEELYAKLVNAQLEKDDNENKLLVAQNTSERLTTYNFLQSKANDNTFNIVQWRNDPKRSNQELIAYSQFVSDRNRKGATNDDKDTLVEIEDLLKEGKFLEAHELVSKAWREDKLTLTTKNNYHNTRIQNSMDFKDHPLYSTTTVVKDGIKALESEMQSGSTLGNRILATNNKIYIQDKLNLWIKENANNPKYENNSGLLQDDFEKEYIRIINNLREYGRASDTLFGKFKGTGFDGTGTVTENIDAEIEKKKAEKQETTRTPQEIADMTIDLKAISSADFQSKYKISKEDFKKEIGIK